MTANSSIKNLQNEINKYFEKAEKDQEYKKTLNQYYDESMQLENMRQNVPLSDYSKFRDDTRSEIDKMKQDPNNYPMKEII